MRRRRLAVLATALLALLCPATASALPTWVPWQGLSADDSESWVRVTATSANNVYAGTEGDGLFKSSTFGVLFQPFSAGLPTGTSIRAIDAGVLDVTVGTDYGVFKSSNGGAFQPLGQGIGADKLDIPVQALLGVPGGTLAGVLSEGVYKSTDGGNTWHESNVGLPVGATVWSLDSFGPFILAATSSGVFRSNDNGATWSPASDGLPAGENMLRAYVDPSDPLIWYAITGGSGVYRSVNAGLSWSPANGSGATGLGSLNTRSLTLFGGGGVPPHSDVYVGTGNGVYASINAWNPLEQTRWVQIGNDGLDPHTNVWSIALLKPGVLAAGAQGGGLHYATLVPPVNTAPPTATSLGTLQVGAVVSGQKGTWTGTETISYDYQWQRCTTSASSSCTVDIEGATDRFYTPVNDPTGNDQGAWLRVKVTASNAVSIPGALTSASSTPIGPVAPNPNSKPSGGNPVITDGFGTIPVGTTLHATVAGWPGGLTQSWRWWRCDLSGANCALVPGTSTAAYALGDDDAGHRMKAQLEVFDPGFGIVRSDLSAPSSEILPRQVAATSAPLVQGAPWIGESLTGSVGSYSGAASFRKTWEYCDDAAGNGCSPITGAGDVSSWQILGIYAGKYVRLRVDVDVNSFNQFPSSIQVVSPAVGPVTTAPAKLATTTAPSIGGRAVSTLSLTLAQGAWAGEPALTQTWYRCDVNGESCTPIAGATGTTYPLGAADVGTRLKVRVTADNAWPGSLAAETAPTAVVAATLGPTYLGGAKLAGKAKVGKRLTAAHGQWLGVPAKVTYRYQWMRDGKWIAKATKPFYKVRVRDRGHKLACRMVVRNAAGKIVRVLGPVKVPKAKPKRR